MSTYRNETHGFEIDLPDGWATTSGFARIPVILSNTLKHANILEEFSHSKQGILNIVVEVMQPEMPPDIYELIFTLNAREMGYTSLEFGRIAVGGRDHAWASYVMNERGWLKKYMLVLNGYGYALTASCPIEQRNQELEKIWDSIAASLRLLWPSDPVITEFNNSPQVRRSIETLREQLKAQVEAQKHI